MNYSDSMGFWPQFQVFNDQSEENSHFDVDPPLKRARNAIDIQPMNNNNRTGAINPPVNQPNGRIFFKTRLCAKFKMGQCRNGENCNFAHGEEDLRKPPPNWQELVAGRADDKGNVNVNGGDNNWEDEDRIIHKMKLCKKYYNGEECPYGDKCNFLHKEAPKFREPLPRFRDNSRESSAISIGTTGVPPRMGDQYEVSRMMVSNGSGGVERANSRVYWRTKLCTRFETTGQCQFGDNCHFAHGQSGGRHADSEPVTASNAPLKSVAAPINDLASLKTDTGIPAVVEGQPKKCPLKWKVNKKINRIYGDWLDDLPLILPNDMEN